MEITLDCHSWRVHTSPLFFLLPSKNTLGGPPIKGGVGTATLVIPHGCPQKYNMEGLNFYVGPDLGYERCHIFLLRYSSISI